MSDPKNERQRLLSLVGDLILANGFSGLTLSGVARSIGSNNRMLLYYFGSKGDLLGEANLEVFARFPALREMTTALVSDDAPLEQRLIDAWARISAPESVPYLRLFFESFGVASHDPEGNKALLAVMGTSWVNALGEAFRDAGYDAATARMLGVQVLALWRGLQFDLIRGTERELLDAAHTDAVRTLLAGHPVPRG